MHKTFLFLFIFALTFSLSSKSFSQPKYSLYFTAGYSQPVGDFKNGIGLNDTTASQWPYMMKDGYNMGVIGKAIFTKNKNVKLVLGLTYNGFKNWGDLSVTTAPPEKGGTPQTNIVQFIPKVAILVLSLGGEYSFFKPNSDINPFAGLDLTANFFSGSFQSNPSSNFTQSQLKAETRFGLQFGGGVDFIFSKYVGAVAGAKYNFANLMGKMDESDVTANQVALNDSHGGKSISYLELYGGVSFFFSFSNRNESAK